MRYEATDEGRVDVQVGLLEEVDDDGRAQRRELGRRRRRQVTSAFVEYLQGVIV